MKTSSWNAIWVLFVTITITVCQQPIMSHAQGDQSFPSMGYYSNQSPYDGRHEVSIGHKDINHNGLIDHNIDTYNAIVGVISRRIARHLSDNAGALMQRDLGDFDELNKLLSGVTINIPDINRINAGKYLFWDLLISASNIVCSDLSISDLIIDHGKKNSVQYNFSLDIQDLAISCGLDWRYDYTFASGQGSARVVTKKNDASMTLQFKSTNFDSHPPSDVESIASEIDLKIETLEIQGGLVAGIANLFNPALKSAIEGAMDDVAKEELVSMGEELLGDVIVAVAELLEKYTSETPIDFLQPEKDMIVPPGVEILDFSTLGSETGNWFEIMLELVDDLLGVTADGSEFNINKLLRSTLLNDDRILQIPLSVVIFDGHDMLTETIIELTNVRLVGLDTINRFDSLERAGNHTLFNHFSWEHLDVEMDFDLTIKPSSKDDSIIGGSDEVVEEQMTITAGINEIDVDFHLLLAADKAKVGGMHIGSFFETSTILPCVLDTIHHVEVAGFAVETKSIDIPTLSGFISPGIDRVMTNAADALFNMYEPVLVKAIPNIFQLTVKDLLNNLIQTSFAESKASASCPIKTFPSNETYVNFPDLLMNEEVAMTVGGTGASQYGHVIRDLMSFLQERLLQVEPDGRSILNERLISKVTELQSGTPGALRLTNEVGAAMKLEIGELVADFEFKVSNATINHVDSIGLPLTLLDPIAPQVLNNTIGVGVGPDALSGSVVLVIGFADGSEVNLRNVVELSVDLRGVVEAAPHLSIIENAFMNFPLGDVLNLNCWLSMMPAPALDSKGVRVPGSKTSMALEDLALAMSTLNLNVTCIDCSSPLLEELAPLFSSDSAVGELTVLMNDVLDYITNLLGGTFLQTQLDRLLAEAPLQCPHSIFYEEETVIGGYESFEYQKQPSDPVTLLFVVVGVVGATIGVSTVVFMLVQFVKRVRQNNYVKTLSEREMVILQLKQQLEIERQYRLNTETTAMFMSPSIPLTVRILVPFVVLANIGFFLSGHLSLGASVDFDVVIAGEAFRIKELFVFSMAESIMDMWEAGAKELAIMILVFSGIWPYTKQLAVLMLWFAPTRFISVSMRESIFIWLDRLGKWSFVDIFVLILSLSSFRVSINTPDNLAYLPKDFFNLNLLVIPCWGLYSNMIAQLISQVNSHFVIHYHRNIQFDHEKKVALERSAKEIEEVKEGKYTVTTTTTPLYKHNFKDTFSKSTSHLRPIASIIITFLAILFVGLIITGCILPSYSLEQFGLVGLTSSKPYIEHDIFSTIQLLSDQATFTGTISDRIGLTVLSSVLILTVLIVPICQLSLALYRWFQPMSEQTRRRVFVALEALSAWQYIEVYLLSIIVASWQLGGVSEFLINDYCGGLEDSFATLQYYGILGVNDAQCFRVSAKLELATWFLIASSIVLTLINHIINSAAVQQEEDLKIDSTSVGGSFSIGYYDESSLEKLLSDSGQEEEDVEVEVEVGEVKEQQHRRRRQKSHRSRIQRRQLRLIESIRFMDYYPCFLQRQSVPPPSSSFTTSSPSSNYDEYKGSSSMGSPTRTVVTLASPTSSPSMLQ